MATVPTPAGIFVKIGAAVASAAILALSGAVVDNRATDATQQVRIEHLETRLAKIDEIDNTVNRLENKVDVLIQRVDDNGLKITASRSH